MRLLTDALGALTDAYLFEAFGPEVWASGETINPFYFGGPKHPARTWKARC